MQRAAHIILARGQWPHVPGVPQASSLAGCGGPPALLVSAARTCMHGRGWCEAQRNPVDIEYLSSTRVLHVKKKYMQAHQLDHE